MILFSPGNYQWNVHAFPLFLCAVLMLSIAAVTLFKKKGTLIAHRFAHISLSVSVWLIGTALGYLSKRADIATWWFRIDNFGVAFISPTVYAFSVALLGYERKKSVRAGYLLGLIMGLWTISSGQIITGSVMHWWGFYPTRNLWSLPFFTFFFAFMTFAFLDMLQANKTADQAVVRNQAKYMLLAFIVAYGGSIDYIPTYQLTIFGHDIYPFGYIFITGYVSIVAYAILKQKLLNIDLVLRDTTTHSITAGAIVAITFLCSFALVNLSPYGALFFEAVISIGMMAFAYDPIRKALQPAIDRVMFANRFGYLEELSQLPNDMLEFTNLRELLEFLVKRLVDAGKLDHATVLMYDPGFQSYIATMHHTVNASESEDARDRAQWRIPRGSPLAELLKSNERLLTREDIKVMGGSEAQGALAELEELRAAASFGVVNKGELVAFVSLGPKQNKEPFNQRDLKILEALKLRLENFLLQAMVATQESLNMVKDSHDMKNDLNALRGWHGLKRLAFANLEQSWRTHSEKIRSQISSDASMPEEAKKALIEEMEQLEKDLNQTGESHKQSLVVEGDALANLAAKLQNWSEYGRLVSEGFKGNRVLEPVSVTDAIQRAAARWKPMAERKNIPLKFEVEGSLRIVGEKSLLEQIIENLIDNALKATDKGQILIRAKSQKDRVIIEVEDTGCGIPKEHMASIFEKPFYQGKGRESLQKSTGIGLFLVLQYAKSLQGTAEVQSEEGVGSIFRVILPLYAEAQVKTGTEPAAA